MEASDTYWQRLVAFLAMLEEHPRIRGRIGADLATGQIDRAWPVRMSDRSLAGVWRLGRSEGARWLGVSTAFVAGGP